MARQITSKQYDAVSQRLERMADGIDAHKDEADFPKRLDSKARRQWRKKIEDLRGKYEKLLTEARRSYDEYTEEYRRVASELSKDDDTLRGYYGKSSPLIADFGTKVIKKPTGRGKGKKSAGKASE